MPSPLFELLANLRGVLYGKHVQLDLGEMIFTLREHLLITLAKVPEYDRLGVTVALLYDYFLPEPVQIELSTSDRMGDTTREKIEQVLTPLWERLLLQLYP